MSNMVLAYGNRMDEATSTGGGWLPELPLANLKDRRLGKVARSISASAADTQFEINLGGPRLVRVVAFVGHNLSLGARYRLRLTASPTYSLGYLAADFTTETYTLQASSVTDSGWRDVWPTVYPFGSLPWGSPSFWSGKYPLEQITAYAGAPLVFILPESVNTQFVNLEIQDEGNPDGYVQIGRGFIADGWQPVRNMKYGASLAWEPRTEVQEAISGAEYFNERRSRRVFRCDLPAMSESEAMAMAFEMQLAVGISKEVLVIFDPDDTVHAIRRQFLARMRTLNPIENPGIDRWRSPFEFQELL